jgi:hypothetical protein
MSAISDRQLLSVWEAAQAAASVFRPAELLRAAGDHPSPETLPIGARDRRLLALRREWFGDAFEALIDCPRCASTVELTFDGRALDVASHELTGRIDEIEFRFPDTTDLAAIRDAIDLDDARTRLAARCIGGEVQSPETIEAVAAALAAADPAADLTVAVTCPECGAAWEASFDPAAYLLRELDGAAMRLFREIDALALAYGWNEGEILSLSRARRRMYLRMVTA